VWYNAPDPQNTISRSYLTATVVQWDVDCTVPRTHSCDTEVQATLPYSTWSVSTVALRLMHQAILLIICTRVALRRFSLYFDWAEFQSSYSECQEFTKYIVQHQWCAFTLLLLVSSWIRSFTDTNWMTPWRNCAYFLDLHLLCGNTSVSGNRSWNFCSQREYYSATGTRNFLNRLLLHYIIVSIDTYYKMNNSFRCLNLTVFTSLLIVLR